MHELKVTLMCVAVWCISVGAVVAGTVECINARPLCASAGIMTYVYRDCALAERRAAPPHEGTSSSPGTIARAGMLAALDVCVWPRGP